MPIRSSSLGVTSKSKNHRERTTMTNSVTYLRTQLEQCLTDYADLFHERISFAAQLPIEPEVSPLTGAARGGCSPAASPSATANVIVAGTPAPARSICASPSYARGLTSRPTFSIPATRARAPSQASLRKPTSTASRPAQSRNWCRPCASAASPSSGSRC